MKGAQRSTFMLIFTSTKELLAHTMQYSILGIPLPFDVNPSFVNTIKTDSPEVTA